MIYAILGGILCNILIFLAALYLVRRSINSTKLSLLKYFSPGENNDSSQFRQAVDLISKILAGNIVNSLKAYLLNINSQEVRQGKAAARSELNASSPLIAGLMSQFPGLAKRIDPGIASMILATLNTRNSNKANEEVKISGGNGNPLDPFTL